METRYTITPLGAAIVEALPDRAAAAKIQRAFTQQKLCPISRLFDEAAIMQFYHGTIRPVP